MTEFRLAGEPLYTAEQVRRIDRCAIDDEGIKGITLMARAAEAAFRQLLEAWPETHAVQVLCGTGNNAGDGFLLADLAHKRGLATTVLQVGDAARISGDALLAMQQARANGVPMAAFDLGALAADGVLVDALLGTGLRGAVRDNFRQAIEAINASAVPVLSLDIPSGLCSDTGSILGTAVRAQMTVCFIALKRGLFTAAGPDHAGVIHCSDLAVPAAVYARVRADCHRLELEPLLHLLPRRAAAAHKGTYGTVLVVGGDYGMAGAVVLAAEAALRCGAGLVRVATRPEHVAALVARTPEVMATPVRSGQELELLLASADVLVVGPGLGGSSWSEQLLQVATDSEKLTVLDADGINLLAAGRVVKNTYRDNWVLTPHPGEAARLLGKDVVEVEADRFAAAQALRQRCGGVILLKGKGSVLAFENQLLLSDYGNPGMASGGMGDVLSGVIGALLAQQLPLRQATALGVCVHGAAGDAAAAAGQRGLLASDLLPELRSLLG